MPIVKLISINKNNNFSKSLPTNFLQKIRPIYLYEYIGYYFLFKAEKRRKLFFAPTEMQDIKIRNLQLFMSEFIQS